MLSSPSEFSSWCSRQYLLALDLRCLGLGVATVFFFLMTGWSRSPLCTLLGGLCSSQFSERERLRPTPLPWEGAVLVAVGPAPAADVVLGDVEVCVEEI